MVALTTAEDSDEIGRNLLAPFFLAEIYPRRPLKHSREPLTRLGCLGNRFSKFFFLATIRLFVARAKKHLQIECNHNLTTTGGRLFEQGTCKLLFVCKLVNTYVPRYIYPVRVKDDFLFNLETV
jgi:hypothetical protein